MIPRIPFGSSNRVQHRMEESWALNTCVFFPLVLYSVVSALSSGCLEVKPFSLQDQFNVDMVLATWSAAEPPDPSPLVTRLRRRDDVAFLRNVLA